MTMDPARDIAATRRLPNGAHAIDFEDGRRVFVTVTKTGHKDSRAWEATPLLYTGRGVPLSDLSRSSRTRGAAIAAAAIAYRAAMDTTPQD
jgi:hypothetical protein